MYLSKVLLKPPRLDNAWEWHRSIWTLFPDMESGTPLPCLYRIESMNLAKGAQILMQSEVKPILESKKASILATKEFDPHFYEGQTLQFLLQANPTKKIKDKDNPERKIRVPLIKEEDQQAWLERKFSDIANLNSRSLLITNQAPTYFRRGSMAGKIVTCIFSGQLTVQNIDAFKQITSLGVGPAKAFGCGLLLVRRE